MVDKKSELVDVILKHLLEIAESKCSITDETIMQGNDENAQQILAGLLILHETLEYREEQRIKLISEIKELNKQLDARVQKQSKAILELSTPVIQIWNDVLVLPLIGAVDTTRAQQIVEQVLNTVAKTGAEILIIDITGVPLVDTAVANYLIKTIEAVNLLGSQSILTGVSPSNAQTLTALGVNLGNILTKGSLQTGLATAFNLTNRTVVETDSLNL